MDSYENWSTHLGKTVFVFLPNLSVLIGLTPAGLAAPTVVHLPKPALLAHIYASSVSKDSKGQIIASTRSKSNDFRIAVTDALFFG